MLWILLMFAGMGLFMLGIVFGEFIDVWYCRTKYDRDDSYKVIEEREDTARKLNREKQKLEKEVHSLYRKIEHITKEWGFEKAKLEDSEARYKSSSDFWKKERDREHSKVWQVLDILAPNYKKLSEVELFKNAKPINPEPIKEEWFDLSKKKPDEGQKMYLKDKVTGTQDLGEFVDRSALGISFIKRNGQKHTSSLMESQWHWRPIESNQGGGWISFEDKEPEIGQEIELKSGVDNWKVLCFYAGNKNTHADGVISADFMYAKDGSVTKYYVGRKTMSWRPT